MGATTSSTKTSLDIANDTVTNVTNTVISNHSTTVSASQTINFSCTDTAAKAALSACSTDTNNRANLIALVANTNALLAESWINAPPPSSCGMCTATNINQNSNISINTSDIDNNKIANDIQTTLLAKINDQLNNKTQGGLVGTTKSQIEALTNIKNHIENNFNTNIVNNTLKTFAYSQTINAQNTQLTNINQTIVATAVASTIISDAIKNNSTLLDSIDKATSITNDTKAANPLAFLEELFSPTSLLAIFGILILLAIGAFIFKNKGSFQKYAPENMNNKLDINDFLTGINHKIQ